MFQDGHHCMGTLVEGSRASIDKVNGGAPYYLSTFQLSKLKNKHIFSRSSPFVQVALCLPLTPSLPVPCG